MKGSFRSLGVVAAPTAIHPARAALLAKRVAQAAVRQLNLTLNPDDAEDFPRIYQLEISDTPLDFNAEVRASGAGALGQTLVITLAEPVKGRYLLMQQKGKDASSWWSVAELSVVCF